jgi:hypothetical protein
MKWLNLPFELNLFDDDKALKKESTKCHVPKIVIMYDLVHEVF